MLLFASCGEHEPVGTTTQALSDWPVDPASVVPRTPVGSAHPPGDQVHTVSGDVAGGYLIAPDPGYEGWENVAGDQPSCGRCEIERWDLVTGDRTIVPIGIAPFYWISGPWREETLFDDAWAGGAWLAVSEAGPSSINPTELYWVPL